jgi:hypothetical protein
MKGTHVVRALALLATSAVLGCGLFTNEPETPPGAPSGLGAAGLSRSTVELTWTGAEEGTVEEYEIERTTGTAAFEPVASAPGGSISYTDEGLAEDTRYRYRIRACNGGGCSEYTAVAVARTFGTLTITTSVLPDGAVGQPYTEVVNAAEAGDSYEFDLIAGVLPAGLVLGETSGIISGTPEAEEIAEFTIRARSVDAQTAERSFTLRIVAALPVTIENSVLPPVIVGGDYDVPLKASGGGASVTWSLVSGSIPAGLQLNPSGAIQGTPTTTDTAQITLRAESGAESDEADFTLVVVADHPGRYDITPLAVVPVPPEIQPHVDSALARWEEALIGDVYSLMLPSDFLDSGSCGGFGPSVNGTSLDDIIVLINISGIDGPGNTLGQAGPCVIRTGAEDNSLPVLGFLTLDVHDLEPMVGSSTLTALVFHEIGHILGFGTIWEELSLIEGSGSNQPAFTGSAAVDEFMAAGGSGTTVPLENVGGAGSIESHWREGIFGNEIMTSVAEQVGVPQPLSRITIASMGDLGYDVDVEVADPFTLAAALVAGGNEELGLDDVYRGPLLGIGPDGSTTVIRRSGGSGQ